MEPTAERWEALARSSPWRFTTLRFVHRTRGPRRAQEVRAWLRRPGDLRVLDLLDGRETRHRDEGPRARSAGYAPLTLAGTRAAPPRPPAPPWAGHVGVELDADGFVRARPGAAFEAAYDDPMYGGYDWVAMLDPVELGSWTDEDAPGAEVLEVRAVDHHGRPAWEALLRPTATYEPRCPCCSLLVVPDSWVAGGPEEGETFVYPDAHRARLDVATGVCVLLEQLGGTRDGFGHEVVIEAVDEPMPDELFAPPRRWPRRR